MRLHRPERAQIPEGRRSGRDPDQKTLDWQKLLVEHGYAGAHHAERIRRLRRAARRAGVGASSPRSSPAPTSLPASGTRASACWCRRLLEVGTEGSNAPMDRARPSAARSSGARATRSRARAAIWPPLQDQRAVRGRRHFVINGQKIWTSSAHYADMMFLLCRTEPEKPKHAGLSYLLLLDEDAWDRGAPAHHDDRPRRVQRDVLHRRARARRPDRDGDGRGWHVANVTLKYERLLLGDANRLSAALARCAS